MELQFGHHGELRFTSETRRGVFFSATTSSLSASEDHEERVPLDLNSEIRALSRLSKEADARTVFVNGRPIVIWRLVYLQPEGTETQTLQRRVVASTVLQCAVLHLHFPVVLPSQLPDDALGALASARCCPM